MAPRLRGAVPAQSSWAVTPGDDLHDRIEPPGLETTAADHQVGRVAQESEIDFRRRLRMVFIPWRPPTIASAEYLSVTEAFQRLKSGRGFATDSGGRRQHAMRCACHD